MPTFEYLALKCILDDGTMRPKYQAITERVNVDSDKDVLAGLSEITRRRPGAISSSVDMQEIQNWQNKDCETYRRELAEQGWRLINGVTYPDEGIHQSVSSSFHFYRKVES